jgi:hypothetical protein
MEDPSSHPKNYHLFEVSQKGEMLVISFQRCLDQCLTLKIRRREVRRVRRKLLKSAQFDFATMTDGSFSVPCAPDRNVVFDAVLNNIGRRLDNIAKRPMTSHEVQEALGISARERIRWTKDNRLRTSGTFTARRQQIVTLNTYAVDYIQSLYHHVRRDKAAFSSGCKAHPATAPAGSNRGRHGGDEMSEAPG